MTIDIPNVPYWQPRLGAVGETVQGLEEVAQAIALLFATLPGDVPLMPGYGFDWHRYLDRPTAPALRRMERGMIMALRRWEPRVEVAALRARADAAGAAVAQVTWRLAGETETVVQAIRMGRAA